MNESEVLILRRSQGSSLFQYAFPSFQFFFRQHESQYLPVWELSVQLLGGRFTGLAWPEWGILPDAHYSSHLSSDFPPWIRVTQKCFKVRKTGPIHSWVNAGTERFSEGWTGRQWQDQEENTHFWILTWETGNGHDKLNYRREILSTFWRRG